MRNVLLILLVAGVVLGPHTAHAQQRSNPFGSTVRFAMADGTRLSGELLAAQRDSSWLLLDDRIRAVPLRDVHQVQIRGKGMDGAALLLWAGLGGLVTGGALTAACSTVSDGCGGVFVATMFGWTIVGGLAAAMTGSPHRWVPPHPDALAAYARFPQGLPPGFDQ